MSFLINPFAFAVAGGDYEAISTYTVTTSGVKNITFSSIPTDGTYQHLQIRGVMRSERSNASTITFKMIANGDTSSSYAYHDLYGTGSSAAAAGGSSATETYLRRFATAQSTANVFGAVVLDILDYADTSKNTTFRHLGGFDNNGNGEIWITSGLWADTAAVSSIQIGPDGQNNDLSVYTTLALYGIKA